MTKDLGTVYTVLYLSRYSHRKTAQTASIVNETAKALFFVSNDFFTFLCYSLSVMFTLEYLMLILLRTYLKGKNCE
jgi:hypothetical protein